MTTGGGSEDAETRGGLFATTHWSVVLEAGQPGSPQSAEALEKLCGVYWYPLYVYARRRGCGPEDAQDLTQQFFARFLEKGSFSLADPARGRFRTFLLKSFQHFLADDWKRAHRAKRGGGRVELPFDSDTAEGRYTVELVETMTPERAFEERWAMTLLEQVLSRMREDYGRVGKARLFEALQDFLWGPDGSVSYAALANDLAMTEGAIRVAVHRLREQYRAKAWTPNGDELLRFRGHTRAVLAVAWSLDDQWIATGSKDQTARIWKVSTGTERLTLAGHEGSVQAVAFTPGGNILATGSAGGTARLWSVSSGQCLRALTNHADGILSLAFSPDGNLLATGSADQSVRLWDTRTGRPIHVLSGHINGVTSVVFSPDGQRLVTAASGTDLYANTTRDMRVFFWDVASGRQLLTLPAHDNAVYAAAFSPDGKRLVTASGDNTARIWTAFPWRSNDYPGDSNVAFSSRIEEFKRHFWQSTNSTQRAADALGRPWTNGFHLYHHTYGDLNLPPPGSKTQPLFPIAPRPAQASSNQIDLSGDYNVALNESWQAIGDLADIDRTLSALPAGLQTFAGVPFDVRGFVQLRGVAPDSELHPDRVVIPVKRVFTRLHALHGTTWFERQGREIGAFVLHYVNGEVAELPIVFGEHLRGENPRFDPKSECPNGQLVWGAGSSADPADKRPRLYKTMFVNPNPELEVVQIDYVSKVTRCGPLLVALTVE
jgi:RNA polymerase sigma factor (sigma-70 family)